MLYRTHVISALEKTREEFARFGRSLRGEVGELAARLVALAGRSHEEVRRASGAVAGRLTYPSDELDSAGAAVLPFRESWRSHEDARRWALEALRGRTTFAPQRALEPRELLARLLQRADDVRAVEHKAGGQWPVAGGQ